MEAKGFFPKGPSVKRHLFLAPAILLSSLASAEESRPVEFGVSPALGRVERGTTQFSVGAYLKIPLSEHFQLKLGDDNLAGFGNAHRFVAGLQYNFGREWISSFFAGLGVGYQRDSYDWPRSKRNYWFGYAEAGKRFTLVHSWGLSYAPQVQVNWGPDSRAEIRVMPAAVSLFF